LKEFGDAAPVESAWAVGRRPGRAGAARRRADRRISHRSVSLAAPGRRQRGCRRRALGRIVRFVGARGASTPAPAFQPGKTNATRPGGPAERCSRIYAPGRPGLYADGW